MQGTCGVPAPLLTAILSWRYEEEEEQQQQTEWRKCAEK